LRVIIDDDLGLRLDDAQECLLNLYHQSGWFLRTVAVLLHSTREQLSGAASSRSAGDGRHINFRLDHAQQFFRTLFGFPESAGGGAGNASAGYAGGGGVSGAGRGVPIWSRGKFQRLLSLAMDLWEVEMSEADVIEEITASVGKGEDLRQRKEDFQSNGHRVDAEELQTGHLARERILHPEDLEECKSCVDRWSEGTLWMLDEKLLKKRLDDRCVARPFERSAPRRVRALAQERGDFAVPAL